MVEEVRRVFIVIVIKVLVLVLVLYIFVPIHHSEIGHSFSFAVSKIHLNDFCCVTHYIISSNDPLIKKVISRCFQIKRIKRGQPGLNR